MIDTHKKYILLFGGSIVHVNATLAKKFDHLKVAMECCIMDGQVPFLVGGIDPGPQFAGEGRVSGVHSTAMMELSELFVMFDEDPHA